MAFTTWRGPSAKRRRMAPVGERLVQEEGFGTDKYTLALEVDKESDPGDLLLALRQLSEDKESLPASTTSDTLQHYGQIVQVVVGDATAAHDGESDNP